MTQGNTLPMFGRCLGFAKFAVCLAAMCLALQAQQSTVTITDIVATSLATNQPVSISGANPLQPGDSIRFTVSVGYTNPAGANGVPTSYGTIRLHLMEVTEKGTIEISQTDTKSGASASGTVQLTSSLYTVPSSKCVDLSSCARAKTLSELRFTAEMTPNFGPAGRATSAARVINQIVYPRVISVTPPTAQLQSSQTLRVTLDRGQLTKAAFLDVNVYQLERRTNNNAALTSTTLFNPPILCKPNGITIPASGPNVYNFQFNLCGVRVIDDNTLEVQLDTYQDAREPGAVAARLGDYSVYVGYNRQIGTANQISGETSAWQANPLLTLTAAPKADAITVSAIKLTAPPRDPITVTPGSPLSLPYPATTQVGFLFEGTYKLTRSVFANRWFGVREAGSKKLLAALNRVAFNTVGGSLPLIEVADFGTFPMSGAFRVPDPPVDLEFFVTLTEFWDDKDPFTNAFAQAIVPVSAQTTADVFISYIQPVQVVHNFPPNLFGGPKGTDFIHTELPVIAKRPTVVRVFVKTRGDAARPLPNVTAVLRGAFRNPSAVAFDLPNPLRPFTAPIVAQPYNGPLPLATPPNFTERSIDFQLPDAWLTDPGGYTIQVELVLPPGVTDPDTANNTVIRPIALVAQPRDELSASATQLVVGYIPVCSNIPGAAPAAPAVSCPSAGIGNYTQFVTNLFPLGAGGLRFFRADAINRTLPFTVTSQAQIENWKTGTLKPLYYRIQQTSGEELDFLMAFLTDTTTLTVAGACPGVVPARNPPCLAGGTSDPIWAGGDGRVVAVVDYAVQVPAANHLTVPNGNLFSSKNVAHELGHVMGLNHVLVSDAAAGGCKNTAGGTCSNWPSANPGIQFPGYNVATRTTLPANTTYDMMSYCGNNTGSNIWVAPFTYRWLYDNNLAPADAPHLDWNPCRTPAPGPLPNTLALVQAQAKSAAINPPRPPRREAGPAQEYLIVTGSASQDGSAGSLDPAFRITTTARLKASNPAGNHCLRFSDADGAVLPGDYCFTLTFASPENGDTIDPQSFSHMVSPPAGAASVTLVRNDRTLGSLRGGPTPPAVTIVSPQPGDTWQGGMQKISWTGSGSGSGALSYILDYSTDGGNRWKPITTPSPDTSFSIESAQLNGGNNVYFRVQASDGLNSSTAQVGPITIVQAPRAAIAPADVDFRNTLIGVGISRTVIVSNSGTGPLRVSAADLSAPEFQLVSPTLPLSIAAGDSATFVLRFTPSALGVVTGTMTLTSDSAGNPNVSVPLRGNGIATAAPDAAVTPESVDFGTVAPNVSVARGVTLQNFGPAELKVGSLAVSGSAFKLTTPPDAFTLALNESRIISVEMVAAQAGPQTGAITINSDDPVRRAISVALRGSVTPPAPSQAAITMSPAPPFNLGSGNVGSAGTLAVTLTNSGAAPLTINSLSKINPVFTLLESLPLTIAAGASARVSIRFTPTAAGAQSDSWTFVTSPAALIPPFTVSGTGLGVATGPPLEISTGTPLAPITGWDFGRVPVTGQPASVTLRVSNKLASTVAVTATFVNSRFTLRAPSTQPFDIGGGGWQNAEILFRPLATDTALQNGSVTFTANGLSVTVALRGTPTGGGSGGGTTTATLAIDSGTFTTVAGFTGGNVTAHFVNRLTPPSYPATLRSVLILFPEGELPLGTAVTAISAANLSGAGGQTLTGLNLQRTISSIGAQEVFFEIPVTPLTIASGDFIVGFSALNPAGVYPVVVDTTSGSKQRSYLSSDGVTFRLADSSHVGAGNFGIRARVDLGGGTTGAAILPGR